MKSIIPLKIFDNRLRPRWRFSSVVSAFETTKMDRLEELEGGQTLLFFLLLWYVPRSLGRAEKRTAPVYFRFFFPLINPGPHLPKNKNAEYADMPSDLLLSWFWCCENVFLVLHLKMEHIDSENLIVEV